MIDERLKTFTEDDVYPVKNYNELIDYLEPIYGHEEDMLKKLKTKYNNSHFKNQPIRYVVKIFDKYYSICEVEWDTTFLIDLIYAYDNSFDKGIGCFAYFLSNEQRKHILRFFEND